ncbi:hypothetical protein Gorai_021457 [Gossypium raimondii]|uniref:Uncharacterized protein n=1 Tax=Gossypium raimondii TaxID=29730 RepID=A0A7J8NQU0_GOSRA|nr:hypothetical protein [Gossypium raimondii]
MNRFWWHVFVVEGMIT